MNTPPRTFGASFSVQALTPIYRDVLYLGLAAIGIVWDHHIGSAQDFVVTIAKHVQSTALPGIHGNGVYDSRDRRFAFATDETFSGLEAKAHKGMMITVAAHEAMHAVQHARGENIDLALPPGESLLTHYHANALEVEARRESLLVLKGYYPELSGQLILGGVEYPVPQTSPYTEVWQDLERRTAVITVREE